MDCPALHATALVRLHTEASSVTPEGDSHVRHTRIINTLRAV